LIVRHFHRTSLAPVDVLATADRFFPPLGLTPGGVDQRSRKFAGILGTMRLTVKMEGGHYTFVEVHTDQVGESRLDKNVKKFFVALHRQADPGHRIEAGY
jgi:hypothetical protein